MGKARLQYFQSVLTRRGSRSRYYNIYLIEQNWVKFITNLKDEKTKSNAHPLFTDLFREPYGFYEFDF
jgi:hypothetical protein